MAVPYLTQPANPFSRAGAALRFQAAAPTVTAAQAMAVPPMAEDTVSLNTSNQPTPAIAVPPATEATLPTPDALVLPDGSPIPSAATVPVPVSPTLVHPRLQAVANYMQLVSENLLPAYTEGGRTFFRDLQDDPWRLIPFLGIGGTLALAKTALFKREGWQHAVELGLMALLMAGPVNTMLREGPRLYEAYQAQKMGNPRQAQQTVKDALTELGYEIFQVYLRPFSLAYSLYMALNLPRILRKPASGIGPERWLHIAADLLRIKPDARWLRPLDKLSKAIEARANHYLEPVEVALKHSFHI